MSVLMHHKRNKHPKDRNKRALALLMEESTCGEGLMGRGLEEGNDSWKKIENHPQLVSILYHFFCFAYKHGPVGLSPDGWTCFPMKTIGESWGCSASREDSGETLECLSVPKRATREGLLTRA